MPGPVARPIPTVRAVATRAPIPPPVPPAPLGSPRIIPLRNAPDPRFPLAMSAGLRNTNVARPGGMRGYLTELAGLQPGQSFWQRPLSSAYRFATTPFWDPWLRARMPRLAAALRLPFKLQGPALLGAGAGFGYFNGRMQVANLAEQLARDAGITDEKEIHAIRDRAATEMPNMARGSLLPGFLGGDTTSLGRMHGDAISELAVPHYRNELYQVTAKGPVFAPEGWGKETNQALTATTSVSPLGLGLNAAKSLAASPEAPDYRGVAEKAVAEHLGGLISDPSQLEHSPLAQSYARILGPNVLQDPGVQQRVAERLGAFPAFQNVPAPLRQTAVRRLFPLAEQERQTIEVGSDVGQPIQSKLNQLKAIGQPAKPLFSQSLPLRTISMQSPPSQVQP